MFAQASSRDRQTEHLHHLCADAPLEQSVSSDRIFTSHPTLLVGGRAERQVRRGLQQRVPCLDTVPCRVDVGEVRSHRLVDSNCCFLSGLDTGFDRQSRIWRHAGGNQHQIGFAMDSFRTAHSETIARTGLNAVLPRHRHAR